MLLLIGFTSLQCSMLPSPQSPSSSSSHWTLLNIENWIFFALHTLLRSMLMFDFVSHNDIQQQLIPRLSPPLSSSYAIHIWRIEEINFLSPSLSFLLLCRKQLNFPPSDCCARESNIFFPLLLSCFLTSFFFIIDSRDFYDCRTMKAGKSVVEKASKRSKKQNY